MWIFSRRETKKNNAEANNDKMIESLESLLNDRQEVKLKGKSRNYYIRRMIAVAVFILIFVGTLAGTIFLALKPIVLWKQKDT